MRPTRYHYTIFKPETNGKKSCVYKQSMHFVKRIWSGAAVEWSRRVEYHIFLIYQKLTVQDFNFQLFGILRVSPVRFDGSPSWYLTFYLNLSGRGVRKSSWLAEKSFDRTNSRGLVIMGCSINV